MVTRSQTRTQATEPQRPAIYLRISEDRRGDELGVTRQEKHCRRLGDRHRWNTANAMVYVDNDISAARKNGRVAERPDFIRLQEDIRSGDRDGVLVYDLDRLLRDPGTWLSVARLPAAAVPLNGWRARCRSRTTTTSAVSHDPPPFAAGPLAELRLRRDRAGSRHGVPEGQRRRGLQRGHEQ